MSVPNIIEYNVHFEMPMTFRRLALFLVPIFIIIVCAMLAHGKIMCYIEIAKMSWTITI